MLFPGLPVEFIHPVWSDRRAEEIFTERTRDPANSLSPNVQLAGRIIRLDVNKQVFYRTARFTDADKTASARAGDVVRLIPGSSNQAVITAIPADVAAVLCYRR